MTEEGHFTYDHVTQLEARWGLICLLGGGTGGITAFLGFDWLSSRLLGEQMLTSYALGLLSSVPGLPGDLLNGILTWEFAGYVLSAILLITAVALGLTAVVGASYVMTAGEQRRDKRRRAKHNTEVRDEGESPRGQTDEQEEPLKEKS